MATYRDEAIVLRTMRLGEADRIVTMLTLRHGKVRAVAKGVRKTKSKIGARLEPLSYVSLLCWHGRELDVVSQVEVIDALRATREDLERLAPATTMLEVADRVCLERHEAPEHFALLRGALRANDEQPSAYVLGAFLLKLLVLEGVGPVIDSCARCNKDVALVAFDLNEGGFLCRDCRRGQAVSQEVVEVCRDVLGGRLNEVLSRPSSPHAEEFERVLTSATEHHLDRRLRSAHHLLERRLEPTSTTRLSG